MKRVNFFKLMFVFSMCFIGTVSFGKGLFVDKTSALGLELGGGHGAFIDYNNDGWVDIYSGRSLWKNNGGKSFSKVFELNANAGNGVCADFDNDGFSDVFCYDRQSLFWNDRGRGFVERKFPKVGIHSSLGASWADYNGDGYVDLYIGGYENWEEGKTYSDVLVLNHAGKSWEKVFSDGRYRARGITSCDFDNDGDVDIYVSNYRLMPNILWRNDGSGKFRDVAASHNAVATWGVFAGGHSIGAVWGDFDNDGYFDIFAGNFAHDDSRGYQPHSFFLRNTGPEKDYVFDNKGQCGLHYQESYASPAAADFDNDGDLDLYFTTVYPTASFGKKNYPVLYRNEGDWRFVDVTEKEGLAKLGPGYQAAWGDIDNDGDLDLLTIGKVFVNQGNSNNWLRVKLVGDGKVINFDAVGSQVRIKLNDKTLTRQVEAGTGQGNQNELTLHFGLGRYPGVVDIEIYWRKDLRQKLRKIKLNQLIKVKFEKKNCSKGIGESIVGCVN